MRYFEAFTGVGGFSLGIQNAYVDVSMASRSKQGRMDIPQNSTINQQKSMGTQQLCVGFSEIDKYASAVLKYRFPDTPNYGDITKIDWNTVPDFDLLVGGSPCVDFSVAGKRAGLAGERSGLFHYFIQALHSKKPKYFIFENVKGLLSSNNGWDFARMQIAFSEAGYSLWWQVLNARDFGVPQNRERIFVVGSRSQPPREVFFERPADAKGLVEITQNAPDAERVYDPDGIGRTLKGLGGGEGAKTMLIRCPLRYLNRNQKEIEGDYAFTVDASNTAGVTDGSRVRRLTPTEAECLMSWPDEWTRWGIIDGEKKEMSDSQRYKMAGNGVCSKVVSEIVKAHLL